jgi:hypothetical protein
MLINLRELIELELFTVLEQFISSTGMKITTGMYITLFAIFYAVSPLVFFYTLLRKIF